MATNNKDFKVKHGLIVEGAQGTINNQTILTEVDGDAYILDLIGGETLITSVSNEFDVSEGGELSIDRTTVDAYYDAAGSAGNVASDLTDHENATEAHGATGAVVGTTNTQTLTNKTLTSPKINEDVVLSATATELNVLDGITSSTAELNILDGVTSTAAELNLLDGVTATTSELNILDGVTSTAEELNILDGVTASTAELNLLDGVTATTTELNYVDGVTSGIQGQLDDKAPLASPSLTGTPLAPTATPGTNNTQIATTAYADAAVAALVDGAPDLLDTLNELAAAINDDADFATTLTTSVGEKVAKSGDTMTGLLVLSADPAANLGAATKQYVDTAESDAISTASADATSKANAAQSAAEATASADATSKANAAQSAAEATASADATSKADTAEANAIAHADALTTDDVEEGDINEYFTDARAKTSAADLLTGATLDNITITGDENGLVITAENGVADSTTADLAEDPTADGTTGTQYFTNQRAVDALEAVTPDFPAVEIASVAKQVAAEATVTTASTSTAVLWAKASYRSAEFLVKIANGSHTEVSKVILTLDTSDNISITEYAIVGTNGSLGSVSADISGTDVRLRVTTDNNDSTVAVVGTLLK
jgi:hypothetical protein